MVGGVGCTNRAGQGDKCSQDDPGEIDEQTPRSSGFPEHEAMPSLFGHGKDQITRLSLAASRRWHDLATALDRSRSKHRRSIEEIKVGYTHTVAEMW